jgi:vitamin B12 transporter
VPRFSPLSVLLVLVAPVVARAQYAAEAVVEPPVASTNEEDPTASGTTITVDPRMPTLAGASVQQVLYEAPGARVVATGPMGQFAGVSLRGAEMNHTTVLLGELPLNGPDAGAFDFSLVPLAHIARVEVYRGGAPVWLGAGAIGGIVRLIPQVGEGAEAGVTTAAGSFGTHATVAHASVGGERISSFASVGVRGTAGNFTFVDDDGRRFEPDASSVVRRRNADAFDGHGLLHLQMDAGGGKLELAALGLARSMGEPGPAPRPALQAQRHLTRMVGTLGWTREETSGAHPYRLQIAMGGGHERDQFTDMLGEIGLALPTATDDQRSQVFGRLAGSVQLVPWLDVTLVGTSQRDAYSPHNRAQTTLDADSQRVTSAMGAEVRVHGRVGRTRLELRPSVRLEHSAAQLRGERGAQVFDRDVRALLPTARVGVAVAPLPWLTFSGSFASGRRLPSMLELFGNRSTIEANPGLDPERSTGGDLGVVVRGSAGPAAGTAEVRAFKQRIEDLIRFRRTSLATVIAENVGEGRIHGMEAALRGQVGRHLSFVGTAQWLETQDEMGRAIPLRPRLLGLARPQLHTGPLLGALDDVILSFEATHMGAFPWDPANTSMQPGRTWFTVALRVDALDRALSVSVAVQDLLDAQGSDLLGWPLPGRRFIAQVSYVKELHR